MAGVTAAALAVGTLVWTDAPDRDTAASAERGAPDAGLPEDKAQEKAVRSGKRVEVTAARTETSTTYALPNRSFRLVSHAAPIRARVDGEWRSIDTTLRRAEGGWAPVASTAPVVFSGGGRASETDQASTSRRATTASSAVLRRTPEATEASRAATQDGPARFTELVRLVTEGHELVVSWPGDVPEPVIDGSRALYRNILPETDLLLTARDDGFHHVLVVHTDRAATSPELRSLSYRLTSDDLVFRHDAKTDVVTAVDRNGDELAVSPTPFAWDSAGALAVTEGSDPEPDPLPDPTEAPETDESPSPGAGAHDGDLEEPTRPPSDADDSEGPVDPAGHRKPTPQVENGTAVREAAFVTHASLTDRQILDLPGLAGPDPGTHAAVGEAELDGTDSHDALLTVTPPQGLVTGEKTEYPLFIDPPFVAKTTNWTTAYDRFKNSSFYDGANYNTGTTEGRVGFESATWGTSRSFFRLALTSLKGARISNAQVKLLETYAWSCDGRVVELWHTSAISSKTTWSNQPDWKRQVDALDVAHGYNSSCPDEYIAFDGRSLIQDAADGDWRSVTIGLKARDEKSAYAWKKFAAEGTRAPKIDITYNRKPKTPFALDQSPGPTCDRSAPYPHIGKRELRLSASSTDPDKNLKSLTFELWRTGYADTTLKSKTVSVSKDDDKGKGSAEAIFPVSDLKNGWTYSWGVKATDTSGASSEWAPLNTDELDPTCRFVYDSTFPNSPEVTSTAFPEETDAGDVWSVKPLGNPGEFTFAPVEDKDVTSFGYSFNTGTCATSKAVQAGASLKISLSPPLAGPNILYVCAKDSAGNISTPTAYVFYVTPRDSADKPGDVTGDNFPDLFVINGAGNLYLYPANDKGDLHRGMPAAHSSGHQLILPVDDESSDPLAPGYWKAGDKPALLAHGGDILPGDGLGDLFARMPDGKLYVYRGDGYGGVDIEQRQLMELPPGPDPALFDQMIVGDYDADGHTDLFATTTSGGLWALTGYTGASFVAAHEIAVSAWESRDLVTLGDVDKDGVPDLLFRSESDNLRIRYGKKATTGGATLDSLATSAGSRPGSDQTYASGWTAAGYPTRFLRGTPDVTGDSIPDIWALSPDGSVKVFAGGATQLGAGVTVISAGSGWGTTKLSFG